MIAAPPPPFVQSLAMADAQVGYAVGGKQTDRVLGLWRTEDGGRTWRRIAGARPQAPPTVVGRRTVYITERAEGAFVVERSGDGGRTWRRSAPLREPASAGPGTVQRLDVRHLYLTFGEGAAAGSSAQSLWRSGDGGATWRFVSRTSTTGRAGALPFSCDKDGVGFATLARGWAGGSCAGGPAFLFRTDDGGRRWRRVRLRGLGACACDVSSPVFFGRVGAFSVDGFPTSGGRPVARVYWTEDGGAHWRLASPPAGRLGRLVLVGGRTAWATGSARGVARTRFDRLFVTTDAGRRWRVVPLRFDAQNYRLDPLGPQVAYAVGNATLTTALLRTADGGRTWRAVR